MSCIDVEHWFSLKTSEDRVRIKYGLLRLHLAHEKLYGTQKGVDNLQVQQYAYETTYPWLLQEYYNEESFD